MIGNIIAFILLLWGCKSWNNGKKSNYIVVAFLFLTNLLGITFLESSIKFYDFFTLLMIYPLLTQGGLSVKGDPIAKVILLLEGYFLLNFIFTVSFGIEELGYAFKFYRMQLYLMIYFVLRKINYSEFKDAVKPIVLLNALWALLFLLQIFGVSLLAEVGEIDLGNLSEVRFRNIPADLIFFSYLILLIDLKRTYKIIALLSIAFILALSQHRGMMLCCVLAFPIMLFVRGRFGNIAKSIVALSIIGSMFAPMIMSRFSGVNQQTGMSMTDEIKKGLTFNVEYSDTQDGATFLFRSYLISERVEYMAKNATTLLFGCGSMHEDSPATDRRFNFSLGTMKMFEGGIVHQKITSSDVAFLSLFMRYGVVLLILLFMLYRRLFAVYYKNDNIPGNIGFALLTYSLLRALSGDEFTPLMYLILLSCACMAKMLNSKNEEYEC